MKNNIFDFKNKLIPAISQWVKLNLLWLMMMVVLRLAFFVVLFASNNVEWSSFPIILSGVYFDLSLVFEITALLLIPFVVLYVFIPKVIYGISVGIVTLYCVIYGCLIGYYNNVMLPLDHVFFVYSFQEIINIIISSVKFSLWPFVVLAVIVALYVLFLRMWNRKVRVNKWISLSFVSLSLLFALFVDCKNVMTNDKQYESYSNYCLATNQLVYTLNSFYVYYENEDVTPYWKMQYRLYDKTIMTKSKEYHSLFPEFTYTNELYPFMRLADDKDVLGDFFDKTTDGVSPNFVFLIIEGLGRNLTAFQPQVSYTPFLDSLASQGLFWPNCLSLAERTFGALPNIFSSAPYDKSGFARPWFPIPDHNSILKDMSKNNYTISYYHGGNLAFDGQDEYLSNNGVSYIMHPQDGDFDKEHMEMMKENNSWGVYDRDMFKAAIRHKDSVEQKRPFTDIYLTLSTHEPFYFKGIEEYEKRVERILAETPDVGDKEKKNINDNKNIYACYLYVDDCVRMLFDYYKKNTDFENTVFVIVGDHRMGRVYVNSSELLKYNVPLIIYSPLVKSPKVFKGVVTHHDIAPSLNAYLKNNYEYSIDSLCHWLGTSFDTSAVFSSKVIVPFMRNNRDINEYLFHDKFIARNRIYEIDDNLFPTEIQDTTLKNKLLQYLEDYKSIDWYVTQNDFLLIKDFDNIEKILDLAIDKHADDGNLVMDMPKDDFYEILSPVCLGKNYEKIYVDFVCDYKIIDKSKSDKLEFILKVSDNEKSIQRKAYKVDALSTNITGEEGWKRLRVKTTCFFSKPVTKGAIMRFYIKSSGNTTLEIKDFNLKIDAIPVQ